MSSGDSPRPSSYHWRRYLEVHRNRESAVSIPGTGFRIVLGEGQPVVGPSNPDDPYSHEVKMSRREPDRLTAIGERLKAATPGPWVCEVEHRPWQESAHYQIKTVEPQPEHPWSPRFLAWINGGKTITANAFRDMEPWQRSRLVDDGVRDDERREPDAQFIAHSRSDVEYLLHRVQELAGALREIVADAPCGPSETHYFALAQRLQAHARAALREGGA